MRMIHKYDKYGNTESAIIYLAKPGKRPLCALGGIDTSTVSVTLRTNNTAELTFTVDKYVDGVESQGYEELDEMMELYCDGIWYKIMDPPTESNDGTQCTKDITAESYEISLTQYKLKNFKINMGEEDSYEMMYQKTHDTSKFYQIKFYDTSNEDLSFLHIVLKHADVPGWKIGYVDNITLDDDKVLLPNEICNFDVDDQSVYAFLTQTAAPAYKCIFEFDTENLLINVYKPDSLGKDTNVVLGFRNIQNSVQISRDDSLVTQFYVDGLDEYNVDLVNFGNSVITDLSHFCCEPYMNEALQKKYKAWQEYRESRRDEYCGLSREYNKNLEILTELMNRVPVDTAQTNWFGQKVEDLKDAYDSNMAIIKGFESIHVDEEGNFDLDDLKNSSDWPMYESIMNYTLPSIVAALQAQGESVDGFGKGNIISCVNPVVLGQDWYMIGTGTSSFQTVQINDAPAYGITRGVSVAGTNGGIYQHNISIEPSQRYTLSCFVKGSGTFYLGYNNTGEDRKTVSYNITSSWTRVYTSFNLSSHLIDVSFTGTSDFTICGMQLEMGDAPSQFGYFTQSESIMKAYETDWKLYGIAELNTKIATYDACIKELKKNGYADGYNPLSGYEEAYFTQMHQKYLDYLNLKEQAEAALKERQAEYDAAKKPEIQEKRNQLAKDVLIENFGKVQSAYPAFSEKEIYIIKSLYNQATYSNENIIVTSLDTTVDAVDKALTLYKDAVEELYVESHPQYTYTDEIGNIYALPEFREYHDQLAVNDFVRLGLTDTRYVKLRVVEISYNPCDMDEFMEVTFSNMVQYKSKLTNDNEFLTNALNQVSDRGGGRVNSVNKSSTSDYVITSDAIKQIFSNPLFNSMLGGTTTGGTGSGGTITANMIVAELVKAKEGVFDKLTVETAFMKYLDANLISADTITTRILNAEQANIEKLSAKIIESNQISADMINVKNLLAGNAGVGNLQAIHLTAQNVTIDQAVITDLIAKKITVADLNTHTATADQIVLISTSKDGKLLPGIDFKNSTQQFYDSTGAVRVQIGQDGTGKFNFVVKNGDKTALFDENGITQTGIPDNTIVNNMISDGTINKEKLSFTMVEPNEQGGIDISQVYLDGKQFGQQYTSFKDQTTKQITNITDPQKGQIVQSIQNSLFNKDGSSIYTQYSEYKQTVDGITQTVSSNKLDTDKKLEATSSSITQNADKISFMVTGNKESGFELTKDFIKLVSSKVSIEAGSIDIDGIITAINTNGTTAGKTQIDAGAISTDNVNALLIRTGKLKSNNYKDPSNTSPLYSQAGTLIDMENGAITSKNFSIDVSGKAYFKGDGEFGGKISANSGYIGGEKGFVIEAGKLYSGLKDFPSQQPSSISTNKNVYVGINGIALGDGNFMVNSNGKLYANQGEFTGKITADSGTIGGWQIYANSLSNRDGSISLNPDGLKLGNQLNIDNQGNATFGGKLSAATGTFSGELSAATGTFSGNLKAAGGTFDGTLNGANGTFSGVLSAATGSFTGAVTATSLTLSGCKINYDTDIENKPDIPSNLTMYIQKDGTIGTLSSEVQNIPTGAKGFKVSSDGLLQASNAIIYGTIYANAGTIGGFYTTTTQNDSEHAYANTLYTQSIDNNGYTYQAGIKGSSTSNASTEAAFYVRKKSSKSSSWADSELPFYVRKNGQMYCEDLTIGNSLYLNRSSYNPKTDSYNVTKEKILSFDPGYNELTLGLNTSDAIYGICIREDYTELTRKNSYVRFEDNVLYSLSANVALGKSDFQFTDLYVKRIFLNGTQLTVNNASSGGISGNYIPMTGTSKDSNDYVKSPVTGTVHVKNNKGWDLLNTDGYEVTGIYCNKSNQVIIGDNSYKTIVRGNGIQLGNNNTVINIPYLPNDTSTSKYLVADDSGNIGWRSVTQGKAYDLANASTYGVMCLYSSTGTNTDGTMTQAAITEAINNAGGGGGSSTPSEAIAYDGITRPIITSGQGSSNEIAYISSPSSKSIKVKGHAGGYSWSTYTITTGSSDVRLKQNISDSNVLALPIINAIKMRQFNWKENGIHQDIGFISDELELLDKNLVNGGGYEDDDTLKVKCVDTFYLQGYEVKAIQELSQQNTSLKFENQSLKNEILMLQGQLSLITQRLQKLEEKLC